MGNRNKRPTLPNNMSDPDQLTHSTDVGCSSGQTSGGTSTRRTSTRRTQGTQEPSLSIDQGAIKELINRTLKSVNNLNYNYEAGAQARRTTLSLDSCDPVEGSTTNNMHAEMVVLEEAAKTAAGKEPLICINASGHIVQQKDKQKIPKGAFRTRTTGLGEESPMDHCGYCTFFLEFLGVPTGRRRPDHRCSLGASRGRLISFRSSSKPIPRYSLNW